MRRCFPIRRRLTRPASRLALALLVGGLALPTLAGCGFHPGGAEIAFLRGGQLIALNADGSNQRTVANDSIVSFAWSPDHHQLVYRSAAGGDAADLLPGSTVAAPDAPGKLVITSINGGRGVQISPNADEFAWSDAWWNRDGNRLVYREEFANIDPAASAPVYILSQSDQPGGIARKTLAQDASMPAVAPDGSRVAVIDGGGTLRLGPPGQNGQGIASGALVTLPQSGRPARVLWQPGGSSLLYATASGTNTAIILRDSHGATHTVATVPTLFDMAFAPDGAHVLLRTPAGYELWPASSSTRAPTYIIPESDPAALAWWSPDGRWLLLQDASGWRLANAASGATQSLMRNDGDITGTAIPARARWHPAAGSPWSADGSQFTFVAATGATWLGKSLPTPSHSAVGLYVASIANGHPAAHATLIDSGNDRAPSWSYPDPATVFLVAS